MIKQAKYLDENLSSLKGQVYLVSGASSGLGYESAKSLLYKGAKVIFAVRDVKKMEGKVAELEKQLGPFPYQILAYEQSDPSSIKALAEQIEEPTLDGAILNAGVYFPKKGSLDQQGVSLTLSINTLGSIRMHQALKEKYPLARYVFVTSVYRRNPKRGDYHPYFRGDIPNRGFAYGLSKKANMVYFSSLLNEIGEKAFLSHPGVSATSIFRNAPQFVVKAGTLLLSLFCHKPWKACLGQVLLAAGSSPSGSYAYPRGPFHISGYPHVKEFKSGKKEAALAGSLIDSIAGL